MLRKKPKSKSKPPKPPKPPAPKDPSTKLKDAQRRKQFEQQSLKYYREGVAPSKADKVESLKIPKSLKTAPSKDKPKAKKIRNKHY
jgi:DNA-nicking Smr family endonuclease